MKTKQFTVTFKAGMLRSSHTMDGPRAGVKTWAEREVAFFVAPSYLRKSFTIRPAVERNAAVAEPFRSILNDFSGGRA